MLTPDPQLQQIRESFAAVGVSLVGVSLHEAPTGPAVGLAVSLEDCLRILRALELEGLLAQEERLGRSWAVRTPVEPGGLWVARSADIDGDVVDLLPGQTEELEARATDLAAALRMASRAADAEVLKG